MKKTWFLLVISVLSLGLLSACTSSADTLPSPSPAATGTPAPTAAPSPTVSVAPAATAAPTGVSTVEDARRVSDDVSEEVEKLSELKNAEAVVAGSIALVGITYDSQYQEGMTDRLKEMVTARVEAIDKTITEVKVTDDEATVKQIAELRKKLDDGSITFEELQTQLLSLGSSLEETAKG